MARTSVASYELEALRKENQNLTEELDRLTDSAADETARLEKRIEDLEDHLFWRIPDQAQRVIDSAIYPSINREEELAKLLEMIQAAQP